jgi:hypothetical protein
MDDLGSQIPSAVAPPTMDPVFRSGSLTAISVVFGFSLSFLTHWASTPGKWYVSDLFALTGIILGIVCQTAAIASLLSIRSLEFRYYRRSVNIFLIGLGLVGLGISISITGDVIGHGQRILG